MSKTFTLLLFFLFSLSCLGWLEAGPSLHLLENLKKAKVGDYVVTKQNKNYSLLYVALRADEKVTLGEITLPVSRKFPPPVMWGQWLSEGAPGNSGWVIYTVDLYSGHLLSFYSVTKQQWFSPEKGDSFLTTLLNLPFSAIPLEKRKRVGLSLMPGLAEKRPIWQPQLVWRGAIIEGIWFEAWKGKWPKDQTPLSEKEIEIYLPQESGGYPIYFPYWLQVSGMVGSAKIRVIDSGHLERLPPILLPPLAKLSTKK